MKQAILDKLAEVEDMLLEASRNGQQLAEQACFAKIDGALGTLADAVEYYVD